MVCRVLPVPIGCVTKNPAGLSAFSIASFTSGSWSSSDAVSPVRTGPTIHFSVSFKLRQDDTVFAWVLQWAFRIAFLCITHGRSLWPVRGVFFLFFLWSAGTNAWATTPACEERTPWCSVTPARWPQLRAVPWAATVVCGDDRSQIHHNAVCDRVPGLPGDAGRRPTLRGAAVRGRARGPLCRAQGNGGPASPEPPPPPCSVPRVRSCYPTGSFLNPRLERGGRDAELFREPAQTAEGWTAGGQCLILQQTVNLQLYFIASGGGPSETGARQYRT